MKRVGKLARSLRFAWPVRAAVELAVTLAVLTLAVAGRSSADEPDAQPEPQTLTAAESWPIDHPTHHVQGLALSDDFFWITSVDRQTKAGWIFRVERAAGKVVAERRIERGAQYHPGGLQRVDERLWVPVAEYRAKSTTTVLALDATTLTEIAAFPVADHLGALAADGQGTLWGANWDTRQIYVLGEDGTLRGKYDNPTGVAYQDWEWHAGHLYATGLATLAEGRRAVVDQLDPTDGRLIQRWLLAGQPESGGHFAREGFSRWRGSFWLLPEDGPRTRVYRFPVPR